MSSRAWLFPSLFEQDAAVVAAGDDRVMQLLGLANLRREIGQECDPLHVAEEPLRRAGLAVRALLVGVPQAGHLGVEHLERPAAAEPRVQGATCGKERVGEYGGAAKREKRFTPIHAMISEGGAPRSRMAPVLGRV